MTHGHGDTVTHGHGDTVTHGQSRLLTGPTIRNVSMTICILLTIIAQLAKTIHECIKMLQTHCRLELMLEQDAQ